MPWPVHPTGFFGARGDQDSYRIERSLRFNSADSAYLNRTFSGTPTTYTMSFWVKRAKLSGGTEQVIFGCRQGASNPATFSFGSTDNILFTSGPTVTAISTTALFRDVSSWYHIVVAVTPSATSYLYVNGSQIGTWTASSNPYLFNSAYTNAIGRYGDAAQNYFDGYLTEINFIDGQALTPSSFGETDAITGRWKAKAYSGTYGTNGFYLKFADNSGTTATTLGKDSSPNGNNWTPNNFSVTAGAGNDSLVDSPTNYGTDTGVGAEVRGNYCTMNPLKNFGMTLSNGNLDGSSSAATRAANYGTIGVSSGKWYWEVKQNSVTLANAIGVGIANQNGTISDYAGFTANEWVYYGDGTKVTNATALAYGASYTTGDTIGVAFDADNGTLVFYKNNTSQGTAFTGLTSGPYFPAIGDGGNPNAQSWSANFGQRPFAYTAPSGFKALCTTNLSIPTIQKPSKYMDVVTYTGNGTYPRTISGLGFRPDLVWIKARPTTYSHILYDSVRGTGTGANLSSNETSAEGANSIYANLTAFTSDGFTIGSTTSVNVLNNNTTTFVAWLWDEAPIAGMDIVGYVGDGTAGKMVSHTLGVAPKLMIVKNRTTAGFDWPVYHQNMNASPQGGYLGLNATYAFQSNTTIWNNTAPTSSVFTLGTNTAVNKSGDNYIAYLFAEVEGFSKFGSYTGNGLADGPFVWCGFRPRWVMMKRIDAAGKPWCIHDTARDIQNVSNSELEANSATAENGGTYPGDLDILSNGFKPREGSSAWINESGTFIFAAFAESPFKYARAR